MINSKVYLQESPEATRTPAIWSDCLIVALVWLVCLALSIHALREEVNTIIDFMMVSSPLEWHKAHHIQVNCQESVGSNAMTHGNQPYLKESEA